MPQAVAIIPAAGLSTRMGSTTTGAPRKQLIEFGGAPILIHTLRKFDRCSGVREIVLPLRSEDRAVVNERLSAEKFARPVRLVEGGETRQDSVWNALATIRDGPEFAIVHDAVRPFIDVETIERALAAAARYGAAIVGVPATDTLKQVERVGADSNRIVATLPRERIVLAQTPQVFRLDLLRRAFEKARAAGFHGTDESALVEYLGEEVYVVPGSARNIKITTPADLTLAEMFFAQARQAESGA